MTIKTKLSLNAVVVLTAISIIIVSALITAGIVDRNVSELTQKTAPYQLKALYQQRELQVHATNLANLSSSRTLEEFNKSAAGTNESLSAVIKAAEEMAKLKGERSTEDKTISVITRNIQDITEGKLKAQDAVLVASKSIQERLAEVTKSLNTFVGGLQQKNSGSMISGVDNLMVNNQQLNNLYLVRDGLKDLNFYISRIPVTHDKRLVFALRDNALNKIKTLTQFVKFGLNLNVKGFDKTTNAMSQRLAALNEKLLAPQGLVYLQLKYLSDEDENKRDKIDGLSKEAGYELSYLLPTIEKLITAAKGTVAKNTGEMAVNIESFGNTNAILSLSSGLSLLSASLQTNINNCIYSKNMNEFNRQVSQVDHLCKEAGGRGQKLLALVTKGKNNEEIKMINAFMSSLATVKNAFFGSGGAAEKVKNSIKNMEDLETLNGRMRQITAAHLKESQNEVLQAGANQENVVASLNQASKRTMQLITVIGGLIILITLLMAVLITRSITKPINAVVEGLIDSAGQVAAASGQVASDSQSLAEGTSEQASGIEETSASIEEMSSMTKQNADNANQANCLMRDTTKVVDAASQSMTDLIQSMQEISTASEETGKIIKTIDEIAFQTNLLALNAAVEAARAGEAGAGFAVVADEVRNLALRVAEAAKNTTDLIEGTIKRIKIGSDIVGKTNESFTKVAVGARKVGELVGEITAASYEQAQGIEQINKTVGEMDRVVQQNAASAEESALAAEKMNAQAEQMKDYVKKLMTVVGGSTQNGEGVSVTSRENEDSGGRKVSLGIRLEQIVPMDEGEI